MISEPSIWAEGKYVDLWTVNHILSGFIAAGWLIVFGASRGTAFVIASVPFWGWEIFERIYRIEEISNQIFDILADYAGFGLFFMFAWLQRNPIPVLLLTSSIFLYLEIVGYIAYRKIPKRSLVSSNIE